MRQICSKYTVCVCVCVWTLSLVVLSIRNVSLISSDKMKHVFLYLYIISLNFGPPYFFSIKELLGVSFKIKNYSSPDVVTQLGFKRCKMCVCSEKMNSFKV